MIMLAVCVILAFQFFAIIDSHTVVVQHGEIGLVNCTSDDPGRIIIYDVDFDNTSCNSSQNEVISQISIRCHNLTNCTIYLEDIIPCSQNETTDGFVKILYYCAIDGGWSEWNEFSDCSLTCGSGVKSRSRICNKPVPNHYGQNCSGLDVDEMPCNTHNCTNPYSLTYDEGEMAQLTCSEAFNETIIVSSLQYYQGSCKNTDIFGIQNQCDQRSMCSFEVNNSNVCSSCGMNGTASLEIIYNCKRDGGWSEWVNNGNCSESCGGGLQTRSRECTNPAPNKVGKTCGGDSSSQEICNTGNCFYDSRSCINQNLNWTCLGGYIEVNEAFWKTSATCGSQHVFESIPVTKQMQDTCSHKRTCVFRVEDATFNVSCQEAENGCSLFTYVYTCHKAQWEAWSEWRECSVSCGIGFQSRKRNCTGQRNTTEGYAVNCEGNSSDSRSCNMNVCPCAPPVFQPDKMNVAIPDHTAVDSPITSLPLLEPDYDSYWQYLRFDYENEYLYIDTRLRSLHLKKILPHIQGKPNSTHEYILSIVDSCKNKINSTIVVVSYNAPPVFTGLKNVIPIDLNSLGNSSYLTSFRVTDPAGDHVSCTIKETTPSTATVILVISDNEMVLHLSENTSFAISSFPKISIHIVCSDGTTEVEIKPVITFSSGEQLGNNDTDTAVIVVTLLFGIILIILVVVAVWYYMKRKRMLMSVKKLSDYVVTHKLSSDDEDDLGEINPVSQHKDENEHAYTSLPKADEKESSNSASFKLAANKGEYVEAWR